MDQELLAILFVIRQFRGYIEACNFLVDTDHKALKYLQSIKVYIGPANPEEC